MTEEKQEILEQNKNEDYNFAIDFSTSSAISRISLKFLVFYVPIFWIAGLLPVTFWYAYTAQVEGVGWILTILMLPFAFLAMWFLFIFGCLFITKLFLILTNLIHKPREGIFLAEKGDKDFKFWCLRIELKKLGIWLFQNSFLPHMDTWVFRWFGLKIDFSSHFQDAWVDAEFINFGRKVLIGQGAVVMSSMIVGKYLVIKKIFFDDYVVIGGQTSIAPGTIVGKDSVIGALSQSSYNQVIEAGWIYFGLPVIKLKRNKYAETSRTVITKIDVDESMKYQEEHDANIDDDKKHLVNGGGNN